MSFILDIISQSTIQIFYYLLNIVEPFPSQCNFYMDITISDCSQVLLRSVNFLFFMFYCKVLLQHCASIDFDTCSFSTNPSLSYCYLDSFYHCPLLSLHLLWYLCDWLNFSPPRPVLFHFAPHHLLH